MAALELDLKPSSHGPRGAAGRRRPWVAWSQADGRQGSRARAPSSGQDACREKDIIVRVGCTTDLLRGSIDTGPHHHQVPGHFVGKKKDANVIHTGRHAYPIYSLGSVRLLYLSSPF